MVSWEGGHSSEESWVVHRTYPFNLSFPPSSNTVRMAVSSARFHQFVTAAVQSLDLPLVLESEDRGFIICFYHWLGFSGLDQVT